MAALRRVLDADLEFSWDWDRHEADVRYGFYRLYELIEGAAADAGRAVGVDALTIARAPIAAATAARWDLHGLLAGVTDADLDADPGGGEWTVRQTLEHIIGTQRAYAWLTAWWIGQRGTTADGDPPAWPKDQLDILLAAESEDPVGSVAEMAARLDGLMDRGAARMAVLSRAELDARGRWSGLPVTVGFRLWRWSSHIREHTIQVEKTLAMLRRDPTEVARLLRLIGATYGRLEANVFCVAPAVLERDGADGSSAAKVLDGIAAVVERYGATISAAALAKVPVTEE